MATSPRQRVEQVAHNSSKRRSERCCGKTRSANLLAVLALAIVAGCTTVALQLVASEQSEPRSTGAPGGVERPELEWSDVVPPVPNHNHPQAGEEGQEPPYADVGSIMAPSRLPRRPLVDRRFTGQRTGRPPKPEEEANVCMYSIIRMCMYDLRYHPR